MSVLQMSVKSYDGKDADLAMVYIKENALLSMESSVIRKIDRSVTPIIACLMCIKMMEKSIVSYGSILDLRDDLNLSQKAYSWVVTIIYFGFLIFEFPMSLLLQKTISKTILISVVVWGILLLCHAACQSYAALLACRFLLGIFECVMNPAYTMLTSQWWKRDEQFMRCCIWVGSQGFGTILQASITYALYTNSSKVLASWRLLYIFTGLITLSFGLFSAINVPETPMKAWFLKDIEKINALERIRPNHQGIGNKRFKIPQLVEAATDLVTYILFIYGIFYSIISSTFSNFGTTLLKKDFGYSSESSILIGMVGGAMDVLLPVTVSYINQKLLVNRKLYICLFSSSITLIGMILFKFSEEKSYRLIGYFSFYVSTIVISGIISNISSNVAGHTKKITVSAVFNIGSSIGSIIGSQAFSDYEFESNKTLLCISSVMGAVCIIFLLVIYTHRNSARDELQKELGSKYVVPNFIEFCDLTDMENPEFRYIL